MPKTEFAFQASTPMFDTLLSWIGDEIPGGVPTATRGFSTKVGGGEIPGPRRS